MSELYLKTTMKVLEVPKMFLQFILIIKNINTDNTVVIDYNNMIFEISNI